MLMPGAVPRGRSSPRCAACTRWSCLIFSEANPRSRSFGRPDSMILNPCCVSVHSAPCAWSQWAKVTRPLCLVVREDESEGQITLDFILKGSTQALGDNLFMVRFIEGMVDHPVHKTNHNFSMKLVLQQSFHSFSALKSKDFLWRLHHRERRSISQIAETCGVSRVTVWRAMTDLKIPMRSSARVPKHLQRYPGRKSRVVRAQEDEDDC